MAVARSRLRSVLALAILAGTAGCARPETAAERHAEEMREAVAKIEAERDRDDAPLGTAEKNADGARAAGRNGAMPVPRVVQLGGPDDPGDADPNEPSARPEIKVIGPGGGRPAPSKRSGPGEVHIGFPDESSGEAAPEPAPAPAAAPAATDPKKAYEDALALVQAKSYAEALPALDGFLAKWPEHAYAENALYWRGEVYYAQGDYVRARRDFETVVAKYPGGSKAPGALLKIGMCHEKTGSEAQARETWARLRREYPRSEAAKKVPKETR